MTTVITCAAVNESMRSTVTGGLLLDIPGAVLVRHDIDPDAGILRRVIADGNGVIDDRSIPLAHACLGCALREDIIPAIREVLMRRPEVIVLALPLSAEPVPALRALAELAEEGMCKVGRVVAAVDGEEVMWDLCGDDLLSERDLGFGADDDRALGEVLARQIECADVVVTAGPVAQAEETVLRHMHPGGAAPVPVCELQASSLLDPLPQEEVEHRGDPLVAAPSGVADAHGVWTVELSSWRPCHPDRLRENFEGLGGTPGRGRGVFWLPTRPEAVCQFDSAGGQISIGTHMTWQEAGVDPVTRLVITGVDGDPTEAQAAFEAALLTDAELAAGLNSWAGRPDDYDPWLGERRDVA
ncbi:CobW family GTP-binding protein [Dermatophilus congolensis]|uniref:Cobalamin biosynthesis protein CobW n=1 Tax=Dermatophilus congolensis TaxID=1863 RepID=A0A239VQX5_9MICO|nr:GTP-binding protein [Dermatophilus congolensis]MBO3129804.1 cobalamin biosynthesis protein CobW [Dermatophilus congolensis]MBO3131567.1 cobalamin biosynthesis protein CobW [Dermatophilus congolensis]MBO3134280.1 cobalamin biosynthesis protein CobW [Dermatophilus congolensis]MBO3136513.1 cobalamin biosynthesis protein CobW [Dermatophilus congolensis]MBO3138758.1 cobalamin biosynthesis protein CobW [Dermatophilus congolensis]